MQTKTNFFPVSFLRPIYPELEIISVLKPPIVSMTSSQQLNILKIKKFSFLPPSELSEKAEK